MKFYLIHLLFSPKIVVRWKIIAGGREKIHVRTTVACWSSLGTSFSYCRTVAYLTSIYLHWFGLYDHVFLMVSQMATEKVSLQQFIAKMHMF